MTDKESFLKVVGGIIVGGATLVGALVVAYDRGTENGRMLANPSSGLDSQQLEVLKSENTKLISENRALAGALEEAKKEIERLQAPQAKNLQSDERVKVVEGFRFDLQNCERQEPDIYCAFMVTNLKQDRELWIDFRSKMIDSAGESYRQCARIHGGRAGGGDYLVAEVPSGIPSRFQLKFCGVAAVVQKIALLELRSSGFSVEWRNIEPH